MNKRDIAILGLQIASKELGISDIEIIFKDSAFFYNPDINAMFIQILFIRSVDMRKCIGMRNPYIIRKCWDRT